jgi:prepilin-type N-terminal cleavage/methylation domain-containing protein
MLIKPTHPIVRKARKGFTLVEMLISMGILAFVGLSIYNVMTKIQAQTALMEIRLRASREVQKVIKDIQADFRQGAYISDNSYDKRLEYTTYDTTGAATKKIYRITTISGLNYLQLSTDGGTTWQTPYQQSPYTRYNLTGTPKFLYAWSINNCTDFVDTNGNGVWQNGLDAAGAYVACSTGTNSPTLSVPSQATKVNLQSFTFSLGMGTPPATRSLPTDLYISTSLGPVRSSATAVAPAAKDSPLAQSFTTNTANSLFGTAFGVRHAYWDLAHDRLVLVGQHSSGSHTLFLANRQGILDGSSLTTSTTTIQANAVAMKPDNQTILVLDSTTKNLYTFDITNASPMAATSTLSVGALLNTPTGLAYDPATASDFYIVCANIVTGALKIDERDLSTGAVVNTWALPATFDVTHPPGGMAIEPNTGDFLVVRNYVNGSAPNHTIDIYRINRANGTSTSFSVNIDDLGSVATGITGYWGISYDSANNRLFLSDAATNKVYEVVPNLLISPRS